MRIVTWAELRSGFNDTLLVGNGASIAVDEQFSYPSLLKAAKERGYITPDLELIFKDLATEDFELVMSMLRAAFRLNQALDVNEPKTTAAYQDVRSALVQAVRAIHPRYDQIAGALPRMIRFMKGFKTVLSLNYDLMVYWAMLEGNRDAVGVWFKDCFVNGVFDSDWERFRKPHGLMTEATLVFYPHGNLMLASTVKGEDSKLAVQSGWDSLLARILRAWQSGTRLPLFVSEGRSPQKRRAILRNGYLTTVYNSVMPRLSGSYLIYGCSLKENDDHILERICGLQTTAIAFGVHNGLKPSKGTLRACEDFEARVRALNPKIKVRFFDAGSAGCWVNP